MDVKLQKLESGLIRLDFPHAGNIQRELALVTSNSLGYVANLSNGVLCYEMNIRDKMKMSPGVGASGAFMGSEVKDSYVENVEGRVVRLNNGYMEGFNPLVLGCNSLCFPDSIAEIRMALKSEGFDVDNGSWDNYKTWAEKKMDSFDE